jgi:hypothetical protein
VDNLTAKQSCVLNEISGMLKIQVTLPSVTIYITSGDDDVEESSKMSWGDNIFRI